MTASEALDAFRASAPVQRLQHGGVEWQYRLVGSGAQGLLLLPGAVGDGDAYFTLAPLSSSHRLIAIAYPQIESLTALLDGLRYILDRERIDSTDIVGGSFGGMIAQAFLRRFPQRTRRIVLSATGPAKPERAVSNQKWARLMGALPIGVTHVLLRLIVRVSLMPVTVDRQGPPSPAGLQEWTGAVLVLEGEADKIARVGARDSLRSLFSGARVHTFPGAGHAISAERRHEWAAIVATFVTGSDTLQSV